MTGHIRERKKGTWAVVIRVGAYKNGSPRYKWHTVHGTKRDAQRELTRLLHELDRGSYAEPTKLTLGAFLHQWLSDYAKTKVAAKTYERYEEVVLKHLIPAIGHCLLVKLTPQLIERYYAEAQERGRRDGRGGLSAQTVLHHHRILHAALNRAVKWQLLTRNPADGVEAPRPEHREMEALDEVGTASLLKAAEGTRYYLPVLIAVTTGMRLGELLALCWEDVDLNTGVLRVRQALEETRDGVRFKRPKTRKSARPIAMPGLLVDALRAHQGEQEQTSLLLGPAWRDHGLVLPREMGDPWPPSALSKAFEHLAARAGCPQIRFHDLRHSHVSLLLKQAIPSR
jgi:integrase